MKDQERELRVAFETWLTENGLRAVALGVRDTCWRAFRAGHTHATRRLVQAGPGLLGKDEEPE